MQARLTIDGFEWKWDPDGAIDISIPMLFNGPQPNAYGVEPASSEPCVSGDLVGDTRQGGSCNFERYTLIPHCNGTHTECVGHITNERISIRDVLKDVFVPAALVTVQPVDPNAASGSISPETDLLITRPALESAMDNVPDIAIGCLIVRTLPNDDTKLNRTYADDLPAYFTPDAMELIVELGVRHLVVDLPSIDRMYDEGRLANHRRFWNVAEGSFETGADTRRGCTITELAYIPEAVPDGIYVMNLQIAPFSSDASPSRPILFAVNQN